MSDDLTQAEMAGLFGPPERQPRYEQPKPLYEPKPAPEVQEQPPAEWQREAMWNGVNPGVVSRPLWPAYERPYPEAPKRREPESLRIEDEA